MYIDLPFLAYVLFPPMDSCEASDAEEDRIIDADEEAPTGPTDPSGIASPPTIAPSGK
jgi:hypothetical protein